MWKKGKNLVALGSSLMKKNDNRVKLEEGENGNTLVILLADTKDAGEYSCEISISGGEPTEIRHSVRIRGKKRYFFSLRKYVIAASIIGKIIGSTELR